MFISACLISVYGLAQHYGFHPSFTKDQWFYYGHRSSSTIGNPNFLGTYLMMAFFVGFYLLTRWYSESSRRLKWTTYIGICLVYACLLTTLTRAAWLGAFIIFCAYVWLYWKHRAVQVLIVCLAFTSLVVFFTSPYLGGRLATVGTELENIQSSEEFGHAGSSRGAIWKFGWKELWAGDPREWLIGSGPDTFLNRVEISPEDKEKYWGIPHIHVDKAHNIYLEMALTFGVPALICFMVFFASLLIWRGGDLLSQILSGTLVGYMIQGFFNIDVISVFPIFMVLMAFLAGKKAESVTLTSAPPSTVLSKTAI